MRRWSAQDDDIADASNRVIATAIAAPFRCTRGVGIMAGRAAPIHIRVNGPGGWYYETCARMAGQPGFLAIVSRGHH